MMIFYSVHAYQQTEAGEDPVASLPAKTGLQGGHQRGEDDGPSPGSTGGDPCNRREIIVRGQSDV
jgi:hypothetical protein